MFKLYRISIPEYNLEEGQDFGAVGKKLDNIIKEHYPDQWVAVRGISLKDHPDKSADWLVQTIQEYGTDRYDPERKGVHNDLDKEFGIDLHAVPMMYDEDMICPHYSGERCKSGSAIGELLNDCHGGAIVDRGYPLRIDMLLLYDLKKLQPAQLIWTEEGPTHTKESISPKETCTFRFKDRNNKKDALLGIIRIDQ